jgi:hypothetical protein
MPLVVAWRGFSRRLERTTSPLLEPAVHIEKIELFGPQHPAQCLAHIAGGVGIERRRNHRSIEVVGLLPAGLHYPLSGLAARRTMSIDACNYGIGDRLGFVGAKAVNRLVKRATDGYQETAELPKAYRIPLATDRFVILENAIDYLWLAQLDVADGGQSHQFVSDGIEVTYPHRILRGLHCTILLRGITLEDSTAHRGRLRRLEIRCR